MFIVMIRVKLKRKVLLNKKYIKMIIQKKSGIQTVESHRKCGELKMNSLNQNKLLKQTEQKKIPQLKQVCSKVTSIIN